MNHEKQTALIHSLLDIAASSHDALPKIYLNPKEFSLFELSWGNGSMSLLEPRQSEDEGYRFNGMEISRHYDVKPGWFAFARGVVEKSVITGWKGKFATPIWTTVEFDSDYKLYAARKEMVLLQYWQEEPEK